MDAGAIEAMTAPIWAALGAVGHKTLNRVEDGTADEAVKLGRRLLARLLSRGGAPGSARPQLAAAAANFAAAPENEDLHEALRVQLRLALTGADDVDDPSLVGDLRGLIQAAGTYVSAVGVGAVSVGFNEGIVSTGEHAKNTIRRG